MKTAADILAKTILQITGIYDCINGLTEEAEDEIDDIGGNGISYSQISLINDGKPCYQLAKYASEQQINTLVALTDGQLYLNMERNWCRTVIVNIYFDLPATLSHKSTTYFSLNIKVTNINTYHAEPTIEAEECDINDSDCEKYATLYSSLS